MKHMIPYKSLSMVLQLRSGEMFPLILRSLCLPDNPSVEEFRRALLNTELACHPYYAYLQRFCRFGYSIVEPEDSNGMLYIRLLRDNDCLQQLLRRHRQSEGSVTFYVEQTRSIKSEPRIERQKLFNYGKVIPCNGSTLSNVPLILQAEAFSSNSSGSINDDQIPKSYPESNNNDSILTTSFDRTTTTAAASSAYFHGDSSGDISSTVEMSHAESAFSMPCPPPMSLMNCCYFQEPYVIPYMSPNWQCNGYYWVVSPFYIPPFGSIDVTPNYSL